MVRKQYFQVGYSIIDYIGFGDNNIVKFIDFQILADTLIIKVKLNENINVILSNGRRVINICLVPGPCSNLISTCDTTMPTKPI